MPLLTIIDKVYLIYALETVFPLTDAVADDKIAALYQKQLRSWCTTEL